MVLLHVPPPASSILLTTSAHGLTDLAHGNATQLVPYLGVLFPVPTDLVTPIFVATSVWHFAKDTNLQNSVFLHSGFVLAHVFGLDAFAWIILSLYMCLIHVPRHLSRATPEAALLAVLVGLILSQVPVHTLTVTDWMQKIVMAHITVEHFRNN